MAGSHSNADKTAAALAPALPLASWFGGRCVYSPKPIWLCVTTLQQPLYCLEVALQHRGVQRRVALHHHHVARVHHRLRPPTHHQHPAGLRAAQGGVLGG